MENYKKTIKFHDAEDMLVISELSISNKNGYPEFTMCNEKIVVVDKHHLFLKINGKKS